MSLSFSTGLVQVGCVVLLVGSPKEVPMAGREAVSRRPDPDVRRDVMVVRAGAGISVRWSLVHVLGVPLGHSIVEVLVAGNVWRSRSMGSSVGTGSFGMRLCNFCGLFLVCLCFLDVEHLFLECVHWESVLEFVIFDAFYHSFERSQLLLVHIILNMRIQIQR